jgi:hypothetical protein
MTPARALAVAALLPLLSCAPQYESGKTACASTGQACPDGYVCINIRCYKAGEAPDGAGGSGGGGSGGSADARVTSTGGTGGSGGAGGASPDGGQSFACPDSMRPKQCPAMGDITAMCWASFVDCATVRRCPTAPDIRACTAGRMVDCSFRFNFCPPPGNRCTDPMFPDFCPARPPLVGPGCYQSGADCESITVCPDDTSPSYCIGVGARVDCTKPRGMRCSRPTVPDGAAPDSTPATDAARDGGPG